MAQIIKFRPKQEVICSFCNKNEKEVKRLFSNQMGKNICDQCLASATEALQKAREKDIN